MQTWNITPGRITIRLGDITTLLFDAIVNAANSQLAGGGGVDGAIHRRAGHTALQAACRKIISEIGSLPTGEAVVTPGFELPSQYVIHTVGPIWQGGNDHEAALLENAYTNSLTLAHQLNLKTIAFPAISCGVYGYPVDQAARIALTALKKGVEAGLVEEATMVLHDSNARDIWAEAAEDVL